MKTIKICMIVHKNFYHDGRVRRYAESLAQTGISVDIVCPAEKYESVSKARGEIRVYSIPIRHANKSRARYILEYLLALIMYFIKLSILHIRNHYEVIHIHNMPDFLIFSALIPKMLGAHIILDIHDPMPEVFMSKYGQRSNSLLLYIIYFQEKISCSLANTVITANSNFKANLIKRGVPAWKITVVNNYPNMAIFNRDIYSQERNLHKENFTLIFPGTIAPRYGLETVIQALPELASHIPEIILLIIGPDTAYKSELLRLADQLGVLPFIRFKPVVPNDEIPHHIVKANIGIYPAQRDVHMDIATPTKVLEFAAMGIPIISSRLKIVEEIFDDSAIMFFDPGNITQFARCVISLYQKPILCENLIYNADRVFVKRHSWEQEFRSYLDRLNLLPSK